MPTQHLALILALLWAGSTQAAGLITGAVQTGGDTDRPLAAWTGSSLTFSNNSRTTLNGTTHLVTLFDEDVLSMTDRPHNWNGVLTNLGLPSYLLNQEYVMIGNNNRDNAAFRLDLTVSQPVSVFLLLDNRIGDSDAATPPTLGTLMSWVASGGWQPVATGANRTGNTSLPDEVGVDEVNGDGTGGGTGPGNAINNFNSIFQRDFAAGTFTLEQQNAGGINMYGVVVTPPQVVPEPGALALLTTAGIILGFAPRRRR